MNKLFVYIYITVLCFSAYGCNIQSLLSIEKLSSKRRKILLEKMHISDLCNYYLDSELQEETKIMVAGLLRERGVTGCSSDRIEKLVDLPR